jgi:broad specificity phosphatase PhoE
MVTNKLSAALYPDPELSARGIEQSKEAGELLRKYITEELKWDLKTVPVSASSMIRAQQTAHHMFPAAPVGVLPCISEQGRTPDNKPLPQAQQREVLKLCDVETLHYLDEKLDFRTAREKKTDYGQFVDFMIKDRPEYLKNKDKIIVVSHSHFLLHIFGIMLDNNQAILATYDDDMNMGRTVEKLRKKFKIDGNFHKVEYGLEYFEKRRKDMQQKDFVAICPDNCRNPVCPKKFYKKDQLVRAESLMREFAATQEEALKPNKMKSSNPKVLAMQKHLCFLRKQYAFYMDNLLSADTGRVFHEALLNATKIFIAWAEHGFIENDESIEKAYQDLLEARESVKLYNQTT